MTPEELNGYLRLMGEFGALLPVVDGLDFRDETIRHCIAAPDANRIDKIVGEALLALPFDQRLPACRNSYDRAPEEMTDAEVLALHRIATAERDGISEMLAARAMADRGLQAEKPAGPSGR
jgi:hypothetical protein